MGFGSSKKKKQIQLDETENAILQCKSCRDKIKQYIKKLEKRQNACLEKAKELLASKERDRAKIYLRQKKLHQEQIKVTEAKLEMIIDQIQQIESTQNLKECMACLKQGNEALRKIQNTMKIEEWEKVKDDFDELKEKDQEIGNYLKEYGIDQTEYDNQVNEEYDKLLKDLGTEDTIDLPNANKEEIIEDKKVEKVENKKKVIAV